MITPEIISYIKEERLKGIPDATIKSTLLANGWAEQDITDAIVSISTTPTASTPPKPPISEIELKKYRDKIKWITFFVLIGIDVLVILISKLVSGSYGIWGISPISITLRVLVIYIVSYTVAKKSNVEESKSRTVVKGIGRVLGGLVVTILIGAGVFFGGCLILASGFN